MSVTTQEALQSYEPPKETADTTVFAPEVSEKKLTPEEEKQEAAAKAIAELGLSEKLLGLKPKYFGIKPLDSLEAMQARIGAIEHTLNSDADTSNELESREPKTVQFEDIQQALEDFEENPYDFRNQCPKIISRCEAWYESHETEDPAKKLAVVGYWYGAALHYMTGSKTERLTSRPEGSLKTNAHHLAEIMNKGHEPFLELLKKHGHALHEPLEARYFKPGQLPPTDTREYRDFLVNRVSFGMLYEVLHKTSSETGVDEDPRIVSDKNMDPQTRDVMAGYCKAREEMDDLIAKIEALQPLPELDDLTGKELPPKTDPATGEAVYADLDSLSAQELLEEAKELQQDVGLPIRAAIDKIIARHYLDAGEIKRDNIRRKLLATASTQKAPLSAPSSSRAISSSDPMSRY